MRVFLRFFTLLFAFVALALGPGAPRPAAAQVDVAVSVTVPPPPLPVYVQPLIPGPGYLWMPGYWAWGPYGYYWVPGTWVLPPAVGLLWTPGYWAWDDGVYFWHAGYWAPRIGYYGGIVYGFGYDGFGYDGGFWDRGHFHYNAVVNNLGRVRVVYVYRRPVEHHSQFEHVSFNGGHGGTNARPTAQQQAFARERHLGPTEMQRRHDEEARGNRELQSSVNHGRPPIAATPRPTSFTGHGVTGAAGASAPQRTAPQHDAAPPRVNEAPRAPREHRGEQRAPASHNAAPHAVAPRGPSAATSRPPGEHQPHAPAPHIVHPANGPAPRAPAHAEPPHGAAQPHGGAAHGPAPRGGEPHGGPPGRERDHNEH